MAKETNISTAQELYNFIFEACNILRGPVSQDNFKDYITPLLYYKRISDVYDEETEEALELSGGDKEFAALPEQHRFDIPDGCHWQDVRERTENVGSALVGAMRQIELANPDTLYGVLSIFGFYVAPTYDFIRELRKFGSTLEVLEPASLRDEFKEGSENLAKIYEK